MTHLGRPIQLCAALTALSLAGGGSCSAPRRGGEDGGTDPADGATRPDAGPRERPCADGRCGEGEVCEAGRCRLDCAGAGPRCGAPGRCCETGEVCHLETCTAPGAVCAPGPSDACAAAAPCPDGEYCEAILGRCLPRAPASACQVRPGELSIDTVVEWEWTGDETALPSHDQVITAPMVADLDADCRPDLVFVSCESPRFCDCSLRAVRGDGSGALFSITDPLLRTYHSAGVAIGDIDGDDRPEIVTGLTGNRLCSSPLHGPLVAYEHDGTLKWRSTDPRIVFAQATKPALADLDRDGTPEILVRYVVVNADGSVRWIGRLDSDGIARPADFVTAADLDGDGYLEVVGGNVAWRRDGTLLYENREVPDGYPAVADLDLDGRPEVVAVAWDTAEMYALRADGSLLWGPVHLNAGCRVACCAGGPPIVADVDGDGDPEVATNGACAYVVLRGRDGSLLWRSTTDTSASGSSVFDFEGDGRAELLFNDGARLNVFDGRDGGRLHSRCNTLVHLYEHPVIADVDADGQAEIVVTATDYGGILCDGTGQHGVRVLGAAGLPWVRTRRVWNQHSYHVTNVEEDGAIPAAEVPNWTVGGLNNFRQNVQTEGLFDAPDLVPIDLRADHSRCSDQIALGARVWNRGAAGAPAGIAVAFRREAEILGTARTTRPLLPGEAELVELTWTAPRDVLETVSTVTVEVDADGSVAECDEMNEAAVEVGCTGPI